MSLKKLFMKRFKYIFLKIVRKLFLLPMAPSVPHSAAHPGQILTSGGSPALAPITPRPPHYYTPPTHSAAHSNCSKPSQALGLFTKLGYGIHCSVLWFFRPKMMMMTLKAIMLMILMTMTTKWSRVIVRDRIRTIGPVVRLSWVSLSLWIIRGSLAIS